jgi:phosphatidylglycerol---prolipoprotein diacylglyceryl transferase
MLPFLHLGGWLISTYGLLVGFAVLAAVSLGIYRAPSYGFSRDFALQVAAFTVLAGVIGSKLQHVFLDPTSLLHPRALLSGGGTFLFGFLSSLCVGLYFGLKHKVSFWRGADCAAPCISLGIAIGRLGCLAAGCDYGKPTSLPWAITFTNTAASQISGVPLNVPLHPSQLYESVYEFLLFVILVYYSRKSLPEGRLFWLFALFYSAGRFLLEFLRGDADRGFWGPLSTSQWLCLVLLAGLFAWYRVRASHGIPLLQLSHVRKPDSHAQDTRKQFHRKQYARRFE